MSDPYELDPDLYPEIIEKPHQAEQAVQETEVIENEDQVLNYTQRKRQQIVTQMMGAKGEKLKDLERGDKMVLLQALDGMDRSALGKKRLKTDEKIGASQAAAAALIAKVLTAPGINQAGMASGITRASVPVLPAEVPDPVLVPGEIATDAPQMDVDTFMAQSFDEGLGQQDK
jgi:hypothetical protein